MNEKKSVIVVALIVILMIGVSSFAAAAFWLYSNGNTGQQVVVNYVLSPLQVAQDADENCKFTLTTTLTDDGVGMAGETITFVLYNPTSSTWETIAYSTTDANGVATTTWYAPTTGIYYFNAKYYLV
ncbi:MAG: hypothetical protein NWE93_06455 [Candidatus Bathyarchaeota archaeon]|nr:hypothetical protein [Candidatus Bathyarchaeota archaeon]